MMFILFGSNNPTGASFLNMCSRNLVETWGRKSIENSRVSHTYCDLSEIPTKTLKPLNGVMVSFAPIWLLGPFLAHVIKDHPDAVKNLRGIIVCSSSSFLTKRFAFNRHDKELSQRLQKAQNLIANISTELSIPFQILAPTLVYGQANDYVDRNFSKLIQLMRLSPFILLPKTTGLRQPIHATQLAKVAYKQAEKMLSGSWTSNEPSLLTLGGDTILSYESMILKIKNATKKDDPARNCLLLSIPDKLFFLLIAPLLPFNPKLFEAILRINSDLSGFTKAHQILVEEPSVFPVYPLSK